MALSARLSMLYLCLDILQERLGVANDMQRTGFLIQTCGRVEMIIDLPLSIA